MKLSSPFEITSLEALEKLYPNKAVSTSFDKELSSINAEYRKLIEASPFFALATIGSQGMDCSPRGDAAGFVHILDNKQLAIPDRRGNNRLDSLRNIIEDPRIALLFLIPGWNECLRINGKAHINCDPKLLRQFAVNEILPASVIIVEIETIYFQCARAIKRSKLWDEASKIKPNSLPTAGQLTKSAVTTFDDQAYDAELEDRQNKTLY